MQYLSNLATLSQLPANEKYCSFTEITVNFKKTF